MRGCWKFSGFKGILKGLAGSQPSWFFYSVWIWEGNMFNKIAINWPSCIFIYQKLYSTPSYSLQWHIFLLINPPNVRYRLAKTSEKACSLWFQSTLQIQKHSCHRDFLYRYQLLQYQVHTVVWWMNFSGYFDRRNQRIWHCSYNYIQRFTVSTLSNI